MRAPIPHDKDPFRRLVAIMAQLRDRNGGCPWDMEQDFETIAPHTIEEAYEVADAIDRKNMLDLREELGDLLLQVVFHAQIASETQIFDIDGVAEAICDKLIRRHPHVFGDTDIADTEAQTRAWEEAKAAERGAAAGTAASHSVLDGVTTALPATTRANKLQSRASLAGFDWQKPADILDKLIEEIGEVRDELSRNDRARLQDEIGDLLFVCVNLAWKVGIDPDTALRTTNSKFERRFRYVEQNLKKEGKTLASTDLEEIKGQWHAAKQAEKR